MDQKEFKTIINNSLKDLVLPRLEKIEKNLDGNSSRLDKIEEKLTIHDEKFEIIIDTMAETQVNITEIKEDISDSNYTIERIETRLNSVINNQDDIYTKTKQLNHRVLRLESKKT